MPLLNRSTQTSPETPVSMKRSPWTWTAIACWVLCVPALALMVLGGAEMLLTFPLVLAAAAFAMVAIMRGSIPNRAAAVAIAAVPSLATAWVLFNGFGYLWFGAILMMMSGVEGPLAAVAFITAGVLGLAGPIVTMAASTITLARWLHVDRGSDVAE